MTRRWAEVIIVTVPSMRGKLIPSIVLVILQLGDFLSTRLALEHGAVETNTFVDSLGLWKAKLLCLALVGLFACHTRKPSLIWALCAFYVAVVGWNLSLLQR
jgi:hypothetical protein